MEAGVTELSWGGRAGPGLGDGPGGGEEGAGLCLPSNLLYIDITSNVNLANITIY